MIIDLKRERAQRRVEERSYGEISERMTDLEFETQATRVRSLIESLIPTMGLDQYSISIKLLPGSIDLGDPIMMINSNPDYEWMTITASMDQCALEDDEDLTYDVLHEGVHVELARLRPDDESDAWRSREELSATRLGRTMLRCLKRGYEQGYDEVIADMEQKDLLILDLKRQVKQRERQIARLEKGKAA